MTIYIVDIEAVDTRYTKQWKNHLPEQLASRTTEDIRVISGGDVPQCTTPGAFLNFGGTNVYKSAQMQQIGELFASGEIKEGDYFLYTDAWNPTVVQLKYMSELLNVPIRIGGMWHAGSYDPQDFLGRLIGDKPWVRYAERAMMHCYDDNFFATEFHIQLFEETFGKLDTAVQVGWPMEYLEDTLAPFDGVEKENIILFPHRIAPEKQPALVKDLAKILPQYEFVFAQEKELTKDEYHTLLAKSKMVFSANLQETLGISWYEGLLVGTLPLVPDRLSYAEMAIDAFKYPSDWTIDADSFNLHKYKLAEKIGELMTNFESYQQLMDVQLMKLRSFFHGGALYHRIIDRDVGV